MLPEHTVAVLIPCYNEAVTIGKVVDDFKRVLPDADIYVYDNNSSDDTSRIAREHGAIVRFEPRQFKGNDVRQMLHKIEADYYLKFDRANTYTTSSLSMLQTSAGASSRCLSSIVTVLKDQYRSSIPSLMA